MPPFKISFFKILTNLTSTLELPAEFTRKHREILPERAKLRIASGATWLVQVEQPDDECFYLIRGWPQFSQDMDLQELEILVFSYIGHATFHVCAYAATAYEKPTNFLTFQDPILAAPSFQVFLTRAYLYRLNVPIRLAKEWGLIGKKKVRLEYGSRKSSAKVKVASKLWRGRRMVDLSTGWKNFCEANGIIIGKAYSLEFVSSFGLTPFLEQPFLRCNVISSFTYVCMLFLG